MSENTRSSTTDFVMQNIACYQMSSKNVKCNKKSCSKTLDPNSRLTGNSCCNRNASEPPTARKIVLPQSNLKDDYMCKPSSEQSSTSSVPQPKKKAECACIPVKLDDQPPVQPSPQPSPQPLSKALENMKEVATMEKRCCEQTAELMDIQNQLTTRISELEEREQEEMKLLKEAENIWATMEGDYKQKLQASNQRQQELMAKQREVETSANKWRQNIKDLGSQLKHVDKCLHEITDKTNKRANDLKCMAAEITDLEKKLVNTTEEIEKQTRVLQAKKENCGQKLDKLKQDTIKIQREKKDQDQLKDTKLTQGNAVVKEARGELAKICRILLKKKLENEDLRAEDKALTDEINLLSALANENKVKCKAKEESLVCEMNKCQGRIDELKLKCTKCTAETDTKNLDKNDNDCKRCQQILAKGGKAAEELVCVCTVTKLKLLNNVLDNLYTGLERQINQQPGKVVAAKVLEGLRNSRTGKLDPQTRKILDVYMSEIMRRVLNLSVIGGAVKTRCEMDSATYAELSVCIKDGKKPVKPPKEDKGTDSKKDPCALWGDPHECNCAQGPKQCICTKLKVLASRSSVLFKKEDPMSCPFKKICNQDCGRPETPITKMYKNLKPACGNKACKFDTNMRAAQCTLDQQIDSKLTVSRGHKKNTPIIVIPPDSKSMEECSCSRLGCDPVNSKFRTVKKTKSKNITETKSMHVIPPPIKRTKRVGDNAKEKKDSPFLLNKTDSNNKCIFNKKNEYHNTFLRKNQSTERPSIFKEVTKPQKKSTSTLNSSKERKGKLLYIRSKNKKPNQVFCLARELSSGNCEFVLDKEYEKEHKEIIKNKLGDTTYCNIKMSKTKSNNYLIDFEESSELDINDQNALLFKSDLGNVTLTTKIPEIEEIQRRNSSIKDSDGIYKELYDKLCTHIHHGVNLPRKLGCRESEGFNESVTMKIGDGQLPVVELTVSLKKKDNCQYYVIFNSDAEKNFVSRMLAWHDQLPIKEVSERGFTVFISTNKSRGRGGWLERCSDGTIIVVKDDKPSKGVGTDRYPRCTRDVSTSCHNTFCDCAQSTYSCANFCGCTQDNNWINEQCCCSETILCHTYI